MDIFKKGWLNLSGYAIHLLRHFLTLKKASAPVLHIQKADVLSAYREGPSSQMKHRLGETPAERGC